MQTLSEMRDTIERVAHRKLKHSELYMLPQLMRCKDEFAVRVLLNSLNYRRKGLNIDASFGTDCDTSNNAATQPSVYAIT
jgi:hypothetical protein